MSLLHFILWDICLTFRYNSWMNFWAVFWRSKRPWLSTTKNVIIPSSGFHQIPWNSVKAFLRFLIIGGNGHDLHKRNLSSHGCLQQKRGKKNQLYEDVGLHYICKHKGLFHPSLLWQPFLLNTTLGKKETRSSNLCLEIKHWLSNARPPEARLWGWFDPPLRWWKIRPIPPNHMPETVQLHSNS